MKISALEIQTALWKDLSSSSQLVMPNFTPAKWWECDCLSVSKAGYWSEYEIKLSVSDYKADAAKEQHVMETDGWLEWKTPKMERKHNLLASADARGPSFFWFIMPQHVADKVEIPMWAGLQVAQVIEDYWKPGHHKIHLSMSKPAPRLHKVKMDQAVITQAKNACYYRYWNTKTDVSKIVRRELDRTPDSPCQSLPRD